MNNTITNDDYLLLDLRGQLTSAREAYKAAETGYKECSRRMRVNLENIDKINAHIRHIEDKKSLNDMFEYMSTEGLTPAELLAIRRGTDKTDYTKRGNYPRYKDVEANCNRVMEVKAIYPDWELTSVKITGQLESMPPQTYYSYVFKTPQGFNVTLG